MGKSQGSWMGLPGPELVERRGRVRVGWGVKTTAGSPAWETRGNSSAFGSGLPAPSHPGRASQMAVPVPPLCLDGLVCEVRTTAWKSPGCRRPPAQPAPWGACPGQSLSQVQLAPRSPGPWPSFRPAPSLATTQAPPWLVRGQQGLFSLQVKEVGLGEHAVGPQTRPRARPWVGLDCNF